MILKIMKTDDLQLTKSDYRIVTSLRERPRGSSSNSVPSSNASGPPQSGPEAEGPQEGKEPGAGNRQTKIGGAGFASLGRDLEERRSFLPRWVVRSRSLARLLPYLDAIFIFKDPQKLTTVQPIPREGIADWTRPGMPVRPDINPDEPVAYGAAVQAAILSGDTSSKSTNEILLLDAANLQIYIWFPQRGPQPSKKPNFHHLIDIRNLTLYGWCGCLRRDDPKTSRTLILTTDRMFEDCPHWSKYPATPVQPTPGSHATAPQGPPPTRIGVINGHFPRGLLYPPPPEDDSPHVVPHHIYGGIHLDHSHERAPPPPGILSNDRPAWPESPIVPREIYLSSSTAQK
ncbi:hypothetical protein CPLU01_15852 [Colletotrichum plurivorum]|uniref:Uncharacterized protein n=1 Tax=Colletotrichum plurivorum TaxID=2175906 RepID=A0A8H6MS20_9PEZI|nr:hypothetical protein CPLU01_15852 [Colletotrichum plurivorum]